MKKNNFFTSLPFKLLMGVFLGICIGLVLNYADGNAADKGHFKCGCNCKVYFRTVD